MLREVMAWTLAILAMSIAIPAQLLMFVAEWVGDKADEWITD